MYVCVSPPALDRNLICSAAALKLKPTVCLHGEETGSKRRGRGGKGLEQGEREGLKERNKQGRRGK